MSWHLYLLTFRLKSPLHIGFHKVMHLFRTRTYVPARPLWGALTAKLTRSFESDKYREIGEFLRKVMKFGYLYIYDDEENVIFTPKYTDGGLKFGNLTEKELSQIEFEKRFVGSFASTSIEPHSLTVEEGMLHEVEFISPYEIHKEGDEPKPVFFRGLLWVSEKSEEKLTIQVNENDFLITDGKKDLKFSNLDTLQVSGERKYGFGQLKLVKLEKINDNDLVPLGFKGKWVEDGDEIKLELKNDDFIWSHVKYDPDLKIKGGLEPIVGRDWSCRGAGKKLTNYGLCWIPGSVLTEDAVFRIADFGIWVKV